MLCAAMLMMGMTASAASSKNEIPWKNGDLRVSDNHRYLQNGDKPFFWLGETGWLLPERLDRDEAQYY
ncbi:MAG: DUF4038 domain-containing protein, partial [Bacteroidaceae bacterium]|nr:DUF4038 domain-containing protein [Bacteroidaceae bacterium]